MRIDFQLHVYEQGTHKYYDILLSDD